MPRTCAETMGDVTAAHNSSIEPIAAFSKA
jgi:hypothetical protein